MNAALIAVRRLSRHPSLALLITSNLGLGLAISFAIFPVVSDVFLRPLPFPQSNRLIQVSRIFRSQWGGEQMEAITFGAKQVVGWMSAEGLPVELGVFSRSDANLSGPTEAERVSCGLVSSSFLSALRVGMKQGRNFTRDENKLAGSPVAIVNSALGGRLSGKTGDALGAVIRLDEKAYTVIGVLPTYPQLPVKCDVLLPLCLNSTNAPPGGLSVIGRLQPSCTKELAQSMLTRAYLEDAKTSAYKDSIIVKGLHDHLTSSLRERAMLLQLAGMLILAMTCSNITSMLLAESIKRSKETIIRMALGASRIRIFREALIESLILVMLAGIVGVVLSHGARTIIDALTPPYFMSSPGIDLQLVVLYVTVFLLLVLGIALVPCLGVSSKGLFACLHEADKGLSASRSRFTLRSALVTVQVSLAVVLVVGSTFLLRSMQNLSHAKPGFDPNRLLTFTVSLSPTRYSNTLTRTSYFSRAIEQLRQLPEVSAVGVDIALPFSENVAVSPLEIERRVFDKDRPAAVTCSVVNNQYFEAMDIPVLRGRQFNEFDRMGSPGVVLVNEAFAKKYFSNEELIGRRIGAGFGRDEWKEIVGVVGNVHDLGTEREALPHIYESYKQVGPESMTFVVRSALRNTTTLTPTLRTKIGEVDRAIPIYSIMTMKDRMAASLAPRHRLMLSLTTCAALALFLALAGIYGLSALIVATKTNEIGIRVALGAVPKKVMLWLVAKIAKYLLLGVCVGEVLAFIFVRVLSHELFGIAASNQGIYWTVGLCLTCAGLVGIVAPSIRILRLDPAAALRHE